MTVEGKNNFVAADLPEVSGYIKDEGTVVPKDVILSHENVKQEYQALGKIVDFSSLSLEEATMIGEAIGNVFFGDEENLFHQKNVTVAVFTALAS